MLLLSWASLSGGTTPPAPLLWEISGPTPSYLFGTIHSAHPQLNRLPAAVESAFMQSHRFYAELDLTDQEQSRIAALFLLPASDRLSNHLTAPQRQRARTELSTISPGLTLEAFERLKPWAFTVTLSLLEDQLAYAGKSPMDLALYQRARAEGKTTGGLETAEEQMGLFEQLSKSEQSQLLDATLDYLEQARRDGKNSMNDTYEIYRQGDPEAFLALFGAQMDVPLLLKLKLQRLLLHERNQRMSERIERLLESHPGDSFFFAVGAAHMASDQGLPELLRKRGYRVTRVRAK
ncbi:TraB/GumN family protein [Motiliproteus sediminis]|uniref:TraB/GumN family protein n=1 Tax=Motiliproteus sediminis TaxID=1468178 RepID=UPI001AEFE211|nr:TraB/GumN family protein [Motiliproteus sediminis]